MRNESNAYLDRLDQVFAAVQDAGVNGIRVSELREQIGGDAFELTAKLKELRSRNCVFYDPELGWWA